MADTIGSLIDKLATVNNKMFFNQEFLYEIKRMTVEDFIRKYFDSYDSAKTLYEKLHKVVDLNLQRQALILEHDKMLVNMIVTLAADPSKASEFVVDQHKTLKVEE